MEDLLKLVVAVFIALAAVWESASGRTKDGKKTKQDWYMAFLATFMMIVVQRPLLVIGVSLLMMTLFPGSAGSLARLEQEYFWWVLIGFFCIEEFLHGSAHLFAHAKRPKNKGLQWIQAFYKMNNFNINNSQQMMKSYF